MENFLCSLCNEQLEITNGNYLFLYNTKCKNCHINEDIDISKILSQKRIIEIQKCSEHNKKVNIHCFDCNIDICLFCSNQLHKTHKKEYINKLNIYDYRKFRLSQLLNREKNLINIFLQELNIFQNKINIYINIIKTQFENEYKLRNILLNNISQKNYSYIDTQNIKNLLEDISYEKINKSITNFNKSKNFIEQYDSLRNILDIALKNGKYIEKPEIYDIINNYKFGLIPIKKNYYIHLITNSKTKNTIIEIIKQISEINSNTFKYQSILKNEYNIKNPKMILKKIGNTEKELSFFIMGVLSHNIVEITIKNISNFEKSKYNFINKIINFNFKNSVYNPYFLDMIHLSDKDNILFNSIGEISLYDDKFNKIKIIDNANYINDVSELKTIKINDNIFCYSLYSKDGIIIINIDNNFNNTKYILQNSGNKIINYFKKEKILFSHNRINFYLINFNTVYPEVIQKIDITDSLYPEPPICKAKITFIDRIYNYFKDESINLIIYKNIFEDKSFYDVEYAIQFKLIENELTEVSKIKLNKNKSKYEV